MVLSTCVNVKAQCEDPYLTAALGSEVWQKWNRTSFNVFVKAYLPDIVAMQRWSIDCSSKRKRRDVQAQPGLGIALTEPAGSNLPYLRLAQHLPQRLRTSFATSSFTTDLSTTFDSGNGIKSRLPLGAPVRSRWSYPSLPQTPRSPVSDNRCHHSAESKYNSEIMEQPCRSKDGPLLVIFYHARIRRSAVADAMVGHQ